MTMPQPAYPRINLNGSALDDLFESNRKAVSALNEALDHLRRCAPHGRDYIGYPEEFERARTEHWQRLKTLQDMMYELDILAYCIHRQRDKDAA